MELFNNLISSIKELDNKDMQFKHLYLICTRGESRIVTSKLHKEIAIVRDQIREKINNKEDHIDLNFYLSRLKSGSDEKHSMVTETLFDVYQEIGKYRSLFLYTHIYKGKDFTTNKKPQLIFTPGDKDDINAVDASSMNELLLIVKAYLVKGYDHIILTERAYKLYILLLLTTSIVNPNAVANLYSRLRVNYVSSTITLDDLDKQILELISYKLIYI